VKTHFAKLFCLHCHVFVNSADKTAQKLRTFFGDDVSTNIYRHIFASVICLWRFCSVYRIIMIQRLNSATTGTLAVMVKLGNIYNLQIQQFVYKNYKICTCWGRERISRYPGCNIPIL